MTQAKLQPSEKSNTIKSENAEQHDKKGSWSCALSENCIQILAWILLTMGLCIIGMTFYLAFKQHETRHNDEAVVPLDLTVQNETNNVDEATEAPRTTHKPILMNFDFHNGTMETNSLYSLPTIKLKRCIQEDCKMVCSETSNIYTAIYNKLLSSSCQTTGVLIIDKQTFPDGLIKNNWLPLNHTVYELMITASNVTKIKSEAFNADIFSNLFFLVLRKLNMPKIESGTLLGLYKLKYLTVDTKLASLDKAFFQPVQTTLTHLKLNAGLTLSKKSKVFGLSFLSKLEYADISHNTVVGSLTKSMFYAVPNLKYLHLSACKISAIEPDAFKYLKKLNLLDLSHNVLTTLHSDVFSTLFRPDKKAFVSLEPNIWNCNCEIKELAKVYRAHKEQFMDVMYCKTPHSVYGTFIDELNLQELGCDISSVEVTTDYARVPDPGTATEPTDADIDKSDESEEEQQTRPDNVTVFQMRCLNNYASEPSVRDVELDPPGDNFKSNTADEIKEASDWPAIEPRDLDYFQFEPPIYEFELQLLHNRSVRVLIADFNPEAQPVNVIWFSEQAEEQHMGYDGDVIDYNCFGYEPPFLLVEGLTPNQTYTFCLIPYYEYTITPFNCLPLHVPRIHQEDDNIWISKDNKEFTVGMLCLIFMLSTFFGAILAFFGIKTYPDLLEGSKNVLVVKKSEKTCYVSTIAESEYIKQSQAKKKHSDSSIKKTHLDFASPETPTLPAPPPPILYNNKLKDLERLSSSKSGSTIFEDSFVAVDFQDDEYELPKSYDLNQMKAERCVPNAYAVSPGSPPPLPKRNSAYSESLVVNRFTK